VAFRDPGEGALRDRADLGRSDLPDEADRATRVGHRDPQRDDVLTQPFGQLGIPYQPKYHATILHRTPAGTTG
jgi:hypothetical protein